MGTRSSFDARGDPEGPPHCDQHVLQFLESNDDVFYLGGDGGVYYTQDQGVTWQLFADMANTQLYTIALDNHDPTGRFFCGTQDNGTIATFTGLPKEWRMVHGGDGGYANIDPINPNVVHVTNMWGELMKSVNGGESFYLVTSGIDPSDKTSYITVEVMDPINPDILYYGCACITNANTKIMTGDDTVCYSN